MELSALPNGAREVLEQAHALSVRTPPRDQAVAVQDLLGGRLASAALGISSTRMLRSWTCGAPVRGADVEHRLQVLYHVLMAVSLAYDDAVAVSFVRGSNPHLDHQSPVRVLAGERPASAEPRLLRAVTCLLTASFGAVPPAHAEPCGVADVQVAGETHPNLGRLPRRFALPGPTAAAG